MLFPSSLDYYSTKLSFKELFMRGMESQEDEEKFGVVIPRHFHFTIEERSNPQTLLLTNKFKDEILNVEILVPDVVFFEEDDDEDKEQEVRSFLFPREKIYTYYNEFPKDKNQFSIPFVAKFTYDIGKGLSFKLRCTAYNDKISLER
ncbi:unnamed protein product [Fraxinus pennsylvanica]|uniref:Uncharacterized protein n=1 Tax=Fraxinus pennsylvanica TaxID=56036 RepID=A0AAD1ZWL3_9LAMI|nr:unnamed protein product [Fraxinus pennsylvanica]